MSILTGIAKVAKATYRYIRYGKQIGKAANNGAKAYRRGGRTVGVNKDGKVIRTIKTKKTGKDTYTTESKTPIPHSEDYNYSRRVTSELENGTQTSIFRCRKSPDGRQSDIYGTPWFIEYFRDRKTGAINGIKDVLDGKGYNIRYKINN